MNSTFINAALAKNNEHIPVWFMRQAGRYLPEYMELKNKYDFRTRTHTPELMTEITLQPLRRYPLDAAIMFSDILTCLEFMGAPFDFSTEGPKLANSGSEVLKKIKPLDTDKMSFVYDGIQSIKTNLKSINSTPLIGFVGAPFTLCSYIIEGGTSKEFLKTKHFMLSEKKEFDKAMEIISESITNYLIAQIDAGVDAVQIFDSWVGFLNLDQYNSFLFQPMKELIKKVKTKNKPVILYSQPCLHLLPSLAKLEPDVISVDWRVDLKQVVDILNKEGFTGAIQGNLDPVVTTLNWDQAKPYVDKVLEQARNAEIRNRYIFNVGHGVNPSTKADTLKEIVDYVHSY